MAQPSDSNPQDAIIGWTLLVVLVAGLALLLLYSMPCSGFSACTTTSQVVSETNGNITTTTTAESQPAKTWWDWFQLAVIPLALAGFAWLLNRLEEQRQAASALDRMQEDRFQSYLDKMTDLLEKGLRTSPLGSEIRSVVRTRTLTVLRGLDSDRRGLLLRFLKESGLIDKNDMFRPPSLKSTEHLTKTDVHNVELNAPVLEFQINSERDIALEAEIQAVAQEDFQRNPLISLRDADLTKVNLYKAKMWHVDLSNADLSGANLSGANLFGSNLGGTTFTGANLSGADISGTYVSGANLSNAKLVGASLVGVFVNAEAGAEPYENTEIVHGDTRSITNLSGADLRNANLSGADLSGQTDLSNANLEDAILRDAVLSGVNLYLAKITDEQLAQVRSLRGATMPDGTRLDFA